MPRFQPAPAKRPDLAKSETRVSIFRFCVLEKWQLATFSAVECTPAPASCTGKCVAHAGNKRASIPQGRWAVTVAPGRLRPAIQTSGDYCRVRFEYVKTT